MSNQDTIEDEKIVAKPLATIFGKINPVLIKDDDNKKFSNGEANQKL